MYYLINMVEKKTKRICTGDGSFSCVTVARKFWESKGYHATSVYPSSSYHRCPECNEIVKGAGADLRCEHCTSKLLRA